MLHLPADSATAQATGTWSERTELAAVQAELLHGLILNLRAVHGDKKVQFVKPLRVPRPWDNQPGPARKPTRDADAIRRFFSG